MRGIRQDGDIRAARFRHGQALRADVRDDDRRGTDGAQKLDMQVADGAAPITTTDWPKVTCAFRAARTTQDKRLGQGQNFRPASSAGRRDHQTRRDRDVFGKGSVHGDAHLLHLGAVQDLVPAAPIAARASDVHVDDDRLAFLSPADARTHRSATCPVNSWPGIIGRLSAA